MVDSLMLIPAMPDTENLKILYYYNSEIHENNREISIVNIRRFIREGT